MFEEGDQTVAVDRREKIRMPARISASMSVQAISGALPFTPGGVGSQQALLVATLHGASRTAVLSYSVGQQLASTINTRSPAWLTM